MIKADFIDRLKEAADIVQIISDLIAIKKAGSQYKGCCPFHNENSPSFNINPVRQRFKCFGCGKSGNAIDFVMAFKNLTYPEAIHYVADQSKLIVEYDTPTRPKSRFSGLKLR